MGCCSFRAFDSPEYALPPRVTITDERKNSAVKLKVGSRVLALPSANKDFKPGPGTVTQILATRVKVLWDDRRYHRNGGRKREKAHLYAPHNLELLAIPVIVDAPSPIQGAMAGEAKPSCI